MQKIVLDTDIVSEILKGRDLHVLERANTYSSNFSKFTFTSVTLLEILYGLERIDAKVQIQRAEALFSVNEEIVPDSGDYRLAATIAGSLDKSGKTIGLADPLIAACAIRRGLTIATGNVSHFGFIRKVGYHLQIENWRDQP